MVNILVYSSRQELGDMGEMAGFVGKSLGFLSPKPWKPLPGCPGLCLAHFPLVPQAIPVLPHLFQLFFLLRTKAKRWSNKHSIYCGSLKVCGDRKSVV